MFPRTNTLNSSQYRTHVPHFDSQRASCRNKSLLTGPVCLRDATAPVTLTGSNEVYFAKDTTASVKHKENDILGRVCAQTRRLPPVTRVLRSSAKASTVEDEPFYKEHSSSLRYDPPAPRAKSQSASHLHAGLARTTEKTRKRIGTGCFESDELDTWAKDGACTRQIAPWEQQNDLYCSNKHLLHTCFPREYNRLLQYTEGSFTNLLKQETAKVKALKQIKTDHVNVLNSMENLRQKGVHGFGRTRVPGQLECLTLMRKDTSIPMKDAFYYYGFHPLPVEAIEKQYNLKAAAPSKVTSGPGVFLWSKQKLRVT